MRPAVPSRTSLLGLLLVAAAACSPSFQAVRDTAALGDRAGRRAEVLLGGPRLCALILGATARAAQAAAQPAQPDRPPPGCAELGTAETAQVMMEGARLLAGYARALSELAQDGRVSFAGLLEIVGNSRATAAGQAGGALSVGSAGQKLSALIAIGSAGWRKKELARLVSQAAPHVVAIGEGLRLHVRLQREALRSLRGGTGPDAERGLLGALGRELADMAKYLHCGDKDTTCRSLQRFGPVWALSLVSIGAWADDEEQSLTEFDAALAGFLTAHEVLARHAAGPGGLGPDDAITQEISRRLGPPQAGGARARSGERD